MNTRNQEPEAFGYHTEVAKVEPTYENARMFRPYQGGNARARNADVPETGTVVLTGFDVEVRASTDEHDSGSTSYTVSYSVDIVDREARASSVERRRSHTNDHTDKLPLDATAAVVARADTAAREFLASSTGGDVQLTATTELFSIAQNETRESRIESVDDVARAQEKAEQER